MTQCTMLLLQTGAVKASKNISTSCMVSQGEVRKGGRRIECVNKERCVQTVGNLNMCLSRGRL